jgi:hypothetical protein
MPKYSAHAEIAASAWIGEIIADTEAEARDKASELAYVPSLCHSCGHDITIGDIIDIHVELLEEKPNEPQ